MHYYRHYEGPDYNVILFKFEVLWNLIQTSHIWTQASVAPLVLTNDSNGVTQALYF